MKTISTTGGDPLKTEIAPSGTSGETPIDRINPVLPGESMAQAPVSAVFHGEGVPVAPPKGRVRPYRVLAKSWHGDRIVRPGEIVRLHESQAGPHHAAITVKAKRGPGGKFLPTG